MTFADIPFLPTTRVLRQFAASWLVFLSIFAAWQWFHVHNHRAAAWLAVAALSVGALGLRFPQSVRYLFVFLMILAFPIGYTVSTLLLGTIFYLVLTPLSLIMRILGRDPLQRTNSQTASFWIPMEETPELSRYFRQY